MIGIVIAISTSCLEIPHSQCADSYLPKLIDPLSESWRWRAFPHLKGLGLKCLEEGNDGSMWFGVDAGAVRYDGLHWKNFGESEGLPEAVISFCSAGARFFAASRTAIYTLEDEHWVTVFPRHQTLPWRFEDLTQGSNGGLWVATNWGALKLHNCDGPDLARLGRTSTLYCTQQVAAAFQQTSASGSVNTSVVATPDHAPWKDGTGIRVYAFGPHGQTIISLAKDGPGEIAGLKVGDRIVAVNGEERLSLYPRELEASPGTVMELTVFRSETKTQFDVTLTCASLDGEWEAFRPYRILDDHAGKVWFATRLGDLISLSDTETGQSLWKHHTRDFDLERVAVPAMALTTSGIAAVGRKAGSRALLKFDGTKWQTVQLDRGINASVAATRDDRLLVGTNGAVISVDDQGQTKFDTSDFGIFNNDILLKTTSDNAIWLAGRGATVLRIEPQGNQWTSYEGLNYQSTGPQGDDWFISDQLTVVRRSGNNWQQFQQVDGLMNVPLTVLTTKTDDVWVGGSHNGVAATAQFTSGKWHLKLHESLSWSIDRRAAFEDREGRVWFAAARNFPDSKGFLGGVVRYDGADWKHWTAVNGLSFALGICQTQDNSVWLGGPSLVHLQPDDSFASFRQLPQKAHGQCDAITSDQAGDLWVGSRTYGVLRVDMSGDQSNSDDLLEGGGQESVGQYNSQSYDESDGLSSNSIKSIVPLSDDTLLVATFAGFDRFDGMTWQSTSLPNSLARQADYNGVRKSRDDSLWVNWSTLGEINHEFSASDPRPPLPLGPFQTIRYQLKNSPPETRIESALSSLPEGEATTISWSGADRWNVTSSSDLTYSWRLNDGQWSPYSKAVLTRLPGDVSAGRHRFQVRARDRDFNVDPSPALLGFDVTPPVWRVWWFQALMLCSIIVAASALLQTFRIHRKSIALQQSNQNLFAAEALLQQSNTKLEQRVLARTSELEVVNAQLQQQIFERTAAETRLLESEVRYRSIVEDQTEYIVRMDCDGALEFANDAYLKNHRLTTGSSADEPEIANIPDHEKLRLRQMTDSLNLQSPTNAEVVHGNRPDGTEYWEEWRTRVLFNDLGQTLGYQAVGRNITNLKEAEAGLDRKNQQLSHLARVSSLGEMVAGISHEINQPLASIANFSSASLLLLEKGDTATGAEKLYTWAGRISEQTQRISEIITRLRRFGRPGNNREGFQIGAAVTEALLVTDGRTRHIVDEITTNCPDTLPAVHADRIQIEQVLVNLIRNACDSMESVPRGQRHLQICAVEADKSVVVTVADSGPGVSSEVAEQLFNHFVTTKSEGMGMGLAISRSIIDAHHGKIRAILDSGCGQFEFSLPINKHVT